MTLSVVFFSTLAGFAFAKLRFRGRNALLLVIIVDDDDPDPARHHPAVHADGEARLDRHPQAVIVPFLVKGFGVFMMRQYAAPRSATS